MGKPRASAEADRTHGRDYAEECIRIWPVVVDIVEKLFSDELEGLIPSGTAPLAFATRARTNQWIAQTLRAINIFREAATLLAATRVVIWKLLADARIIRRLLLANNHSVSNVNFPRARTGAICGVCRAYDFVPRPDFAVK